MSKQYIIFRLGTESFAASIDQVVSITDAHDLSYVPNAPDYIEGLMNLRGEVLPVINLKKRFDLPQDRASKRILISRVDERTVGYLVDDASQSITKEERDILPPPNIALRDGNDFLSEVAIEQNRLILVVDLHKVLSTKEYEQLADHL